MSPTLIGAILAIVTAATIYTIAVFAEYRSHQLKPWHTVLFWGGLVFDTIGTSLMARLVGGFEFNLHGVLGVLAIVLMILHAGWATIVLLLKRERFLHNFHHFSLTVWTLWMISLVTGFALAIPGMMAS
jgi:uncharacterized repeat protein (TIGR03987 family)